MYVVYIPVLHFINYPKVKVSDPPVVPMKIPKLIPFNQRSAHECASIASLSAKDDRILTLKTGRSIENVNVKKGLLYTIAYQPSVSSTSTIKYTHSIDGTISQQEHDVLVGLEMYTMSKHSAYTPSVNDDETVNSGQIVECVKTFARNYLFQQYEGFTDHDDVVISDWMSFTQFRTLIINSSTYRCYCRNNRKVLYSAVCTIHEYVSELCTVLIFITYTIEKIIQHESLNR